MTTTQHVQSCETSTQNIGKELLEYIFNNKTDSFKQKLKAYKENVQNEEDIQNIINKIYEFDDNAGKTRKEAMILAATSKDNYEIAKILIENGADVNLVAKDRMSALSHACHRNNNNSMVKLLMENGANPSIIDAVKQTSPMLFAAQLGNIEIMKMLCNVEKKYKHSFDWVSLKKLMSPPFFVCIAVKILTFIVYFCLVSFLLLLLCFRTS